MPALRKFRRSRLRLRRRWSLARHMLAGAAIAGSLQLSVSSRAATGPGGASPATQPALLADAAERQDWRGVRSALGSPPASRPVEGVNAVQPDGMTALHWAVRYDETEVVAALLAAGADARATNHFGVSPLSLACENGNEAVVSALLKAGAEPDAALNGNETPLMTAARTGRAGPVRLLIAAGAKVDSADKKGQTALMWAAAAGNVEVVDVLVAAHADPHARLKSGFTPLLFAAREGKADVCQALLKAGVDVNEAIKTTQKGGGTAAKNGTSALLLAIENGHFQLASDLLKAGADPNDDRSGYTPLHTLTRVRKPDRGDGPDGMPPPIGSGDMTSLQLVRLLVDSGAKVDARVAKGPGGTARVGRTFDLGGATPFFMACKTADLPYMKLLVELGADPKAKNAENATPLMVAAGLGTLAPTEEAGTEAECLAAVAYLLVLGADINAVDDNGETAMHGAAYKSLPKMVAFLAEKGHRIDVWNHKNEHGWTPLLIAQGFRPGNFKPDVETAVAIEAVMKAAGVTPPPAPPPESAKPRVYKK